MLITLPDVAGRYFISVPMNIPNLIRDEIFRGKSSSGHNQQKPKTLEERTPSAPNT